MHKKFKFRNTHADTVGTRGIYDIGEERTSNMYNRVEPRRGLRHKYRSSDSST